MELVLVEFEYEYTGRNGALVSIKPNERYILVAKTNDHWWHVRKDQATKPFYLPAKYVRELPAATQGPLDPGPSSLISPETLTDVIHAVTTRGRTFSHSDALRDTHRMSTFGYSDNTQDIKPFEHTKAVIGQQQASTKSRDIPHQWKRCSLAPDFSFTPDPPAAGDSQKRSLDLHVPPKPTNGRPQMQSVNPQPLLRNDQDEPQRPGGRLEKRGDPSVESYLSEDLNIYESISDILSSELTGFPVTEFSGSLAATDTSTERQQKLDQTARSDTASPSPQVDNEGAQNAVYVNIAQLRQSVSDSSLSASPLSPPPLFLDLLEGWEVHTDQDSGQEYYYHPASGQTTWDPPLPPCMDPADEPLDEPPCSPAPSESPALSPRYAPPSASTTPASSPPTWTCDWEQLLDETSGRPYFYNSVSGETSWEPPPGLLCSPSPPMMEPQGGHRPQEDRPPPFPEEDYPAEDYPAELSDPQEDEPPVSYPNDFTFSHLSQAVIPRASLDRSAPAGWNLSIDPDGTWVFTSEHSQEQWIKSLDDRGQTYYYLKGGSQSQWNLPEAPVASGQSKVGNGVELDGVSVMKNWRHTMCPTQFSTAQEEGKFFPTHKRNASDYGSEGSSAGNSPEMQHHVQNLEKAGILNKTKVSENGKRVRKNWAQSWTVLHGGVLTFHKDPKSTTTGASNKTNQIVPEVSVELRGATIGWAPRDKSSKKNVLELKSKSGAEFLIQYDTESIISDWHKVLTDTIRAQEPEQPSDEEDEFSEKSSSTEDRSPATQDKRRSSRPTSAMPSSGGETDQKKVRTKLIKFLLKRPTLQSVKEKGYIRDNVFGCHLATLCAQERTTIPSFVEKSIKAVERRGLDIDGIYRVSGNLAVIQKLRFKADHEELDLEDGQWEDVHVITGALKLFFRELPEPLFPFSHFNNFIQAIRTVDYKSKVSYMCELVRSLPRPNHDTMELLFSHLRKVIEFGEENRMTVQNVAIVFGPTLLRPETESANITMHMVFQNQIVELILNEYQYIFHSS